MEKQRNNNNYNRNNNGRYNNNEGRNNRNDRGNRNERPQRKRRVNVDRNIEVVVVSNVIGSKFFYENPRMSQNIDLAKIGDEEYITVGDLRTMLNSNRKILEGFQLLITDVTTNEVTLEDVLIYLGLDKKYEEYYSLANKQNGELAEVTDIKDFILKAPFNAFEKTMEKIDSKLRTRVIEMAVVLFKLKEFGDYNKMRIIESYVNDELFADANETEVDEDIYI
ncbi:hypothetical protein CN984_12360 [Bacillus cereus]|uniref:Uncharacterized protein n=1 Tax=Bacillus cereus TaxID=1396 RepID=A0A2A7FNB5_BACCE|nr:hypothetical protein [Bacillus cereus]PEA25800.1 hypothetical protein CON44_17735 [Bacillus cereus]PGO29219.1 hypothetical protein CN984_12360 [Bacillus cereus]